MFWEFTLAIPQKVSYNREGKTKFIRKEENRELRCFGFGMEPAG